MSDQRVQDSSGEDGDLVAGDEDLGLLAGLVEVFADPVYVAVADPDEGFVFAATNRPFLNHCGRPSQDLIGRPPTIGFGPELGKAMLGRWSEAVSEGRSRNYTITGVGVSQADTVNVTLSPSHDHKGRSFVVGVVRDITDSIRAGERLAILFAHASEGVAVLNRDLTVTEVLFGGREIWGCTEHELLGRNLTDLIHPDDFGRSDEIWKQISVPDATKVFEFRSRRGNGEWRWTECVIANLFDHPEVEGYAVTVRDCHERRLTEFKVASTLEELQLTQAELLHTSKLESVGQLAAGIAHEINTPMQYIASNTHFLQATMTRLLAVADAARAAVGEGSTEADHAALADIVARSKLDMLRKRAPKALDDVLQGVETVSSIVKAMKRFAHTDSEQFERLDVNGSLTTTITISRNEWKHAAEMQVDLQKGLPPIEGWPGPLNQVWLNMIVNSAQAITDAHEQRKGIIRITTASIDDGTSIQVKISDNGSGMEPDVLARVFDPFFTTKEVGSGSGQGLAIAHQVIVTQHHGSITVDSVAGKGTTFTITLPVVQPEDEAEQEADAGSAPVG
jgi:PAS domain S-box-containing protein